MCTEQTTAAAATGAGRLGAALAIAVLAVASASSAVAADATPGLRVVKDPVTGQLRAPTAAEAKALQSSAVKAQPRGLITGRINPPSIRHADGSVEQELDESSLSYTVARRNADGKVEWVCVTGPQAATKVMNGKLTPAQAAAHSQEHDHEEK